MCSIHLSYPTGSTLIQCPQCSATIDPNVPQQTRCVNCKTLLAYPPNSLFIQCPKVTNAQRSADPHCHCHRSPHRPSSL